VLTRLIGRADTVGKLAAQLPRQRFLTIVGPGGIGKTSVALAVAEQLLGAYENGARLIDLAPLSDARLVPAALATALGLKDRPENPLPALIASLKDKKMLLVLDNCEHVIDAAAALAVEILKAAKEVHILATSREPLRAEGEWVMRLPALDLPSGSAPLTAAEALGYSAVQLFNERAEATIDGFVLSDAEVPAVLEICRRLDGTPLALELAAAQVAVFGIRGLAALLDDRLAVLSRGWRTALPRHQTLRAAIDWSYYLLPAVESSRPYFGGLASSRVALQRKRPPSSPRLSGQRLPMSSKVLRVWRGSRSLRQMPAAMSPIIGFSERPASMRSTSLRTAVRPKRQRAGMPSSCAPRWVLRT
jgi:predicted ATPase